MRIIDDYSEDLDLNIDYHEEQLDKNSQSYSVESYIRDSIKKEEYSKDSIYKVEYYINRSNMFLKSEIDAQALRAYYSLLNLFAEDEHDENKYITAIEKLLDLLEDGYSFCCIILNSSRMRELFDTNKYKKIYANTTFYCKNTFPVDALYKSAVFFFELNEYNKSFALFEKIIEKDKDIKLEKKSEYMNMQALCYICSKEYDQAMKHFEKMQREGCFSIISCNNYAYTCYKIANQNSEIDRNEEMLCKGDYYLKQAIENNNLCDIVFATNKMCIDYSMKKYDEVIHYYKEFLPNLGRYNYKEKETIIKLQLLAKIHLGYTNSRELHFEELVNEFNIIYTHNEGEERFFFYTYKLYNDLKNVNGFERLLLSILYVEYNVYLILKELELDPFEYPDSLYYYTKIENIRNMLEDEKNRMLFFSSDYMNDPNEGCIFLNSLYGRNPAGFCERFVFSQDNQSSKQQRELFENDTYIKSLTSEYDSLPMWVNYGNNGKGCCIKINPHFFGYYDSIVDNRFACINPFNKIYDLYKVIYVDNENLYKCSETLQTLLYGLERKINIFDIIIREYNIETRRLIIPVMRKIFAKLKYLFKKTDFEYEHEIRIVMNKRLDDIVGFTETSNNEIPKVFIKSENSLVIDEVMLGPKVPEVSNVLPYISEKLSKMHNGNRGEYKITRSAVDYR